MAQITEAGIRDAKATLERGDRSAREKATRQLKSWQLDRSEENIELYMALKVIVKDQRGDRCAEAHDEHLEDCRRVFGLCGSQAACRRPLQRTLVKELSKNYAELGGLRLRGWEVAHRNKSRLDLAV